MSTRPAATAALLTSLLLLLPLVAAAAQEPVAIAITAYGTYTSKLQSKDPTDTAVTGFINRVTDVKLIEQTDKLCARLGLDFGLDYLVHGTTAGVRPGAPVELQMVTRFPAPGIVDPQGRRFATSTYTQQTSIGGTGYRSYTFEYAWEIVAGEWVFEFHHRGRKIAEQRFTVATACGIS